MLHNPIQLHDISLSFANKICFQAFTRTIYAGNRIGIIGSNGSGKSTLLKIIQGIVLPFGGTINIPEYLNFGYVPQILLENNNLSGAERFNKALTKALAECPDVLCLDEPTNHLDRKNRQSLMRMLQHYAGSLIIVTHDVELLRTCINEIWHIDGEKVYYFTGSYDNYFVELNTKREHLEQKLKQLKHTKKQTHIELMQEQKRVKNKKTYGKKKYGPDGCGLKAVANQKQSNAELAAGKNLVAIALNKEKVLAELHDLRKPEIILPKFTLAAADCSANKTLVYIDDGACGYTIGSNNHYIVHNIKLHIKGGQHIAIKGANASGKSTIIKAILDDRTVIKAGVWQIINKAAIGYVDQHYNTLTSNSSVLDIILQARFDWDTIQARKHLHDFLFRKNEEVYAKVQTLSGGEKARLSLAQIAASSPKLLILDEVTNNLDLETREHVIQVLAAYPGAILVISHDEDFLTRININIAYYVGGGLVMETKC